MPNIPELTVGLLTVVRHFKGWDLSPFWTLNFMLEDTLTCGCIYLLWVEGPLLPGCP